MLASEEKVNYGDSGVSAVFGESRYILQQDRLVATDMNVNGFRTFLGRKYVRTTVKTYVSAVRHFEGWLKKYRGKKLEAASERDLRDWTFWAENEFKTTTTFRLYLSGVRHYYSFKPDETMTNTIDDILSKRPPFLPPQRRFVSHDNYRKVMSETERTGINNRNRALLNFLWSEMNSSEILGLLISDVDFKNRLILKKYRVTREAWDALERYVPLEERDKRKLLFPIGYRRLLQITREHFESVGQTPQSLKLSCQEDLMNAGREKRFYYEGKPREIIESEAKPHDAYKQIDKIIGLGKQEVKIIDPYVSDELFELYLHDLPSKANLRIITNGRRDRPERRRFELVAKKLRKQKANFWVRRSSTIHDRYIIVDDQRAWLVSQSIKDAGTRAPLAIIEIQDVDAVLEMFDNLWNKSRELI